MNTEVQYMYRDPDNYKEHRSVVFAGAVTAERENVIMSALDDEVCFLPEQVGLAPASFGEHEGDHPWHELVSITLTDRSPTESESIAEFAQRFDGIVWDESGAGEASEESVRDQVATIIDAHEWSHLGGSLGEQLADKLAEHGLVQGSAISADALEQRLSDDIPPWLDRDPVEFDGDGAFRDSDTAEDVVHDNRRRAGFALTAVQAYAKRTGSDSDSVLSDLLTDLMHLADATDQDFDAELTQGRRRYDEELNGEV